MFEKVKDMYRLQKEAKSIKHELKNIHIEAAADNVVSVTVSGEFELIEIRLTDEAFLDLKEGRLTKSRLEESEKKAINKALKKAQEISGQKTKHLFKEMGVGA